MGIPLSGISAAQGSPAVHDQANAVIAGAFTGTGVSAAFCFYGSFNVVIYGNGGPNGSWTGSVQLERSFDGGATWIVCNTGGTGQLAVYATGTDVSLTPSEPEKGVAYRLDCTAVTGAINYRMSATGGLATSNGIPA